MGLGIQFVYNMKMKFAPEKGKIAFRIKISERVLKLILSNMCFFQNTKNRKKNKIQRLEQLRILNLVKDTCSFLKFKTPTGFSK